MPAPGPHVFDTSKRGLLLPAQEFHGTSPIARSYSDTSCPVIRQFWIDAEDMQDAGRDEHGNATDFTFDDIAKMFLGVAFYDPDTPTTMGARGLLNRVLPMIDGDDLYKLDIVGTDRTPRMATRIQAVKGFGGSQGSDDGSIMDPESGEIDTGQIFERYLWTVEFDYVPYAVINDAITLAQDIAFNYREAYRYLAVREIQDVEYQRVANGQFVWRAEADSVFNGQPAFNPTDKNGKPEIVGDGFGKPYPYSAIEVEWLRVPVEAIDYGYINSARGSVNFDTLKLFMINGLSESRIFSPGELLFKGASYRPAFFPAGEALVNITFRFAQRWSTWLRFPYRDGTFRQPKLAVPWADPHNPNGLFVPQFAFNDLFSAP